MQVIRRGAEAEISLGRWMGRPAIFKCRLPKPYRHPELDQQLRASRTKNEAKLLQEARRRGVPTPIIFDICLAEGTMVMQYIEGPRAKDLLESAPEEEAVQIAGKIGTMVAKLHAGGMTHGDLTTSNMIVHDGRVYLIDISLGSKIAGVEEMGVDMHLLREAFQSAHSSRMYLFDEVVRSYSSAFPRASEVLAKVHQIEARGRYT
ncbi:MAG: KEOPS complex kinase/ATPase Bud32 [Methanomassiliicoccales archaeon]